IADGSSTVEVFGYFLCSVQGTVQNSYRIVPQREPLDNGPCGSASSDYQYILVLGLESVGFDRSECSFTVCAVPDKAPPDSGDGVDCASLLRHVIKPVDQFQNPFLVGHRNIEAVKAQRASRLYSALELILPDIEREVSTV